ncbi:hypothetical protein AB0I22_19775 [Streptomyces sp. NPDC050610]|uniref:hypothetical protein n=1 Tax=Streptomyces sp. NPDC050610 TaxID=3157097 RepID=UPI003429F84A
MDHDIERTATRLIRQHFAPVADWRHAHDFHIPTGGLYLTPEPDQTGYIPEDDRSFGMSPIRYINSAYGGGE